MNDERWKFVFGPRGLNSLKADRFKDVAAGAVVVVVVVDLDFCVVDVGRTVVVVVVVVGVAVVKASVVVLRGNGWRGFSATSGLATG